MTRRRAPGPAIEGQWTKEAHWPVHECPPWCHACPMIAGGAVMPMCYGTIQSFSDAYDLSSCTCDPQDPAVARRDLADRTETLIRLLRDKRRARQVERIQVERLMTLVKAMPFWTRDDLRRNLPELQAIAGEFAALAVNGRGSA